MWRLSCGVAQRRRGGRRAAAVAQCAAAARRHAARRPACGQLRGAVRGTGRALRRAALAHTAAAAHRTPNNAPGPLRRLQHSPCALCGGAAARTARASISPPPVHLCRTAPHPAAARRRPQHTPSLQPKKRGLWPMHLCMMHETGHQDRAQEVSATTPRQANIPPRLPCPRRPRHEHR